MARSRNVTIDFSGLNYDTSSLFTVNANAGVPTTSSVTYNQLTSAGSGFDMTINEATTVISITASNGICDTTVSTSSFYSWPFPEINPVRLGSSGSLGSFTQNMINAVAYVPENDDVYVYYYNQVKKYHNKTGEEYTVPSPFDSMSIAYEWGDLVYIPKIKAFAQSSNNNAGFRLISMSGEMLYTSSVNTTEKYFAGGFDGTYTTQPYVPGLRLKYDGDRYVYGLSDVKLTSTEQIKAAFYRIDIDTLSFDSDWLDSCIANFPTANQAALFRPLSILEPLSSSADQAVVIGGNLLGRSIARVGSGSGAFHTLTAGTGSFTYFNGTGTSNAYISCASLTPEGDLIVGGYFDQVNTSGTLYNKYDIIKVNASDLNPTPFTSSFNPYTSHLWNRLNTIYYPKEVQVDSNGNVIVGGCYFPNGDPVTTMWNVFDTKTSYIVLNNSGSFNTNWNYPSLATTSNDYSWVVYRIYVQPDDSYYMTNYQSVDTGWFNGLNGFKFDGETIGNILFFSSSGVLVDNIAP